MESYQDAKYIYDSLSDQEKNYMSPSGRFIDSPHLVYRYIHRESGQPVGMIECYPYNMKSKISVFMIYAVKKEYRGKGITGYMVNHMIQWLRSNTDFKKVIYRVDSNNQTSIRSAQKIGFKLKTKGKSYLSFYRDIK